MASNCTSNLKQMDGAKEQWALECKKSLNDVPGWNDLFGSDNYIQEMFICPDGCNYSLNAVKDLPAPAK